MIKRETWRYIYIICHAFAPEKFTNTRALTSQAVPSFLCQYCKMSLQAILDQNKSSQRLKWVYLNHKLNTLLGIENKQATRFVFPLILFFFLTHEKAS